MRPCSTPILKFEMMEEMKKQFYQYVFQNVAGMIGISIYILADTFFISVSAVSYI